ncbi:copper-binding protein [Massilia orientalis]|uniref:Copper-binding protein n=1 Tax=Massilia orientalis TaxID=3050128 RepID=A0ACC7MIT2_9BURK|nr:copper-binding protein [Massilia sp. YIM B02787]
MKHHTLIATMLALAVSGLGTAQAQSNQTGMNATSCQDMMKGMNMKGMDMKNMDAKSCQDMMKGMDMHQANKGSKMARHEAVGTVKSVDPAAGTVTLAHGPVKSLNWPAMTMGFAVKDKALFDKLSVGKKVDVEIVQQDDKYVITAVK